MYRTLHVTIHVVFNVIDTITRVNCHSWATARILITIQSDFYVIVGGNHRTKKKKKKYTDFLFKPLTTLKNRIENRQFFFTYSNGLKPVPIGDKSVQTEFTHPSRHRVVG